MTSITEKTVCLIGGGSLGSEVAQLLINAGVQKLMIFDPETLSIDNIGRHLLGSREVGRNKAEALRDHLTGQFPHVKITAIPKNWQDFMEEADAQLLLNADLLISLTGEWPSDCQLNSEIRARGLPPLIFGWTEPHGYAGHALYVGIRGGCLACGRDAFGQVLDPVTKWKDDQLQANPACGGFFQPYGAIETGPIKSVIAGMAIDALINKSRDSELRSWLGSRELIEALGGTVNAAWEPFFTDPEILGRIVKKPWTINEQCPLCQET